MCPALDRIIFTHRDQPSTAERAVNARLLQIGKLQESVMWGILSVCQDRSMRDDVGERWQAPVQELARFLDEEKLGHYTRRFLDGTGDRPELVSVYYADYSDPAALPNALRDRIHDKRALILPSGLPTAQLQAALETPALQEILDATGDRLTLCELDETAPCPARLAEGEGRIRTLRVHPQEALLFALTHAKPRPINGIAAETAASAAR